jgi:transcriptional regulator with XRE-family HTH domain
MDAVMQHPLAEFRSLRGLSRAQVAELLGVTVAMVGHIERGVRRLSAEKARHIEETRGVPAAVLRPDLFGPRSQ